MSKTRFLVSPPTGRPILGMIIPYDGCTFSMHLGGRHPDYDAARHDGYQLQYQPSPHWRDALPTEIPLLVQELDPEDWPYIPDLAAICNASATTSQAH